jgi:UDP-3-O-[3-hydroxymyristoyl] glucosamine N-acyltransferase
VITEHVVIAGSNIIEDDVWIAPNASIRGWLTIGKGATVGMGAVVVKDIPAGETWVGNPARKLEK